MIKGSNRKFLDYSHNRDDSFKKTSKDMLNLINTLADQKPMIAVYRHFEDAYGLPAAVVKQKIKRHLSVFYTYQEGRFTKALRLNRIVIGLLIHVGFLLYALFFSRVIRTTKAFSLIVDGIISPHELQRFTKLIQLFGTQKVLVTTCNPKVPESFPDYNYHCKPNYRGYERYAVFMALIAEGSRGLWVGLQASLKLKINLFPTLTPVVKDFLQHLSLFKANHAQFLIQERHYNTSAVKNYLFKKYGGREAASIQKNVLMMDHSSFYYDLDCLFALGKKTSTRALKCGGRIGKILPVGSLFMEHYWFNEPHVEENIYDIVMLGINASTGMSRLDAYNGFVEDYYGSIYWLVRFKKEFTEYRIVIKHHASAPGEDEIEKRLIDGSGIQYVNKLNNSYECAFSSRCAVTFGSTRGYELNAHGLPTLFLDPGGRCKMLPDPDEQLLGPIHVTTYEDFRYALLDILEKGNKSFVRVKNTDALCLESSKVSERIFDFMTAGASNGKLQVGKT